MIRLLGPALVVLFCALVALPAAGRPAASPAARARKFSLTFSPIHLAIDFIELSGEFSLAPKMSVAAIVGSGSVSTTSGGTTTEISILELGGQFRYYLSDAFDGWHGAGELLWVGALGDASNDSQTATATAAGLSVGMAGGYKHTFGFGLVLEFQGGYSFMMLKAEATSGTTSATKSQSSGGPLINLNAGWAF